MKIQVDNDAKIVLLRICDAALRASGIDALNDVNSIMSRIAQKEKDDPDTKPPKTR